MENQEHIKNKNKALLASNIILGCLLIVAMALLAITTINNNVVTANASSENLLTAPVKVEPNYQPEVADSMVAFIQNIDTIGLEAETDYNITITYNGMQYTIPAEAQLKDNGCIYLGMYVEDGNTSEMTAIIEEEILVQIVDKAQMDGSTGIAYAEGSTTILAYRMVEETMVAFEPFTINSIKEMNNLLKEEITYTIDTHGTHLKDYSIGLETGKTYKLRGIYGENSLPFEMIATPIDMYEEIAPGFESETDEAILTALEDMKGVIVIQFRVTTDIAPELTTDYVIINIYDNARINEDLTDFYKYTPNTCMIELSTSGNDGAGQPVTYQSIVLLETTSQEAVVAEDLEAGTIIENITGSFTGFLTGTGEGIVDFFETIFTNGEGGLSVLGIVALTMMGLGLATGIIKYLLAKTNV